MYSVNLYLIKVQKSFVVYLVSLHVALIAFANFLFDREPYRDSLCGCIPSFICLYEYMYAYSCVYRCVCITGGKKELCLHCCYL